MTASSKTSLSRRDSFKAMVAVSAAGLLGSKLQAAPAADSKKKGPGITIAGYDFDRVAPIADGRVQVEGFNTTFEVDSIGQMNTKAFSGSETRDVTEIGLHPYMLAYANHGFRDYVLLPIFPLRTFRHKSIFIRTDRGIKRPEDLKGKTVATPGFSSTSLTWLRGILQHEYGVTPEEINWIVSDVDSSADLSGGASDMENVVPEGLDVRKGPKGKDESDMLADGDVDALLHAAEPKCFLEGDPNVSRLYSDFRSAEQAYYKKTGIFPIMHVVAVHRDTVKKHPGLPKALFEAYSKAKSIAYKELEAKAWAYNSLPWVTQELENTKELMGDNFWSYGIPENRKVLEALFQYSHEQGLAKKQLTIEEVFATGTLTFTESA